MTDRERLFRGHILSAIDDIAEFTADGRDKFFAERKTQSAVIRQLEIIGEAVKQLSPALTSAEPAVPWREIAGTRDRLIHGYFTVDIDAVWSMIERDLPALRAEVSRIAAGNARG